MTTILLTVQKSYYVEFIWFVLIMVGFIGFYILSNIHSLTHKANCKREINRREQQIAAIRAGNYDYCYRNDHEKQRSIRAKQMQIAALRNSKHPHF